MSLLNMLGGMATGLIADRAAKYSNPMLENLFSQDPAPIEDRSTQAIPAQMQDVPTFGVVPEASMPPVSGYDLPPMPSGEMEINLPDFGAPEDDIGILAAQYDLNPGYVESAMAEGMTIPDLREAAQLSDALYDGQKRLAALKLKKAQGEDTSEDESMLSKIGGGLKNFFGSEKGMLSMALAFNTLRNKPDNQLAAGIQDRLKTIGENSTLATGAAGAIKTLTGLGRNDLAELVASKSLTGKEALSMAFKSPTEFDATRKLAQTEEGRVELKRLRDLGVIGNQTNLVMEGEKAESVERAKLFAKRMSDMAEGRTKAIDAKASIEALMLLGEDPQLNAIPNVLRGFVPKGVSAATDAYQAALVGVAQSQRQTGTGAQSDKDIELLIQKAGPISTDIQARRIAQQMLKDKAQRNIDMGNIATEYSVGLITKEEAVNMMQEIEAKPLISDRLRQYLDNLINSSSDDKGGSEAPVGAVETFAADGETANYRKVAPGPDSDKSTWQRVD